MTPEKHLALIKTVAALRGWMNDNRGEAHAANCYRKVIAWIDNQDRLLTEARQTIREARRQPNDDESVALIDRFEEILNEVDGQAVTTEGGE